MGATPERGITSKTAPAARVRIGATLLPMSSPNRPARLGLVRSGQFQRDGFRAEVDQVILVDENDEPIGTAEKLAAHRHDGQLHRAFSIFLFDERGRMLIQRRASEKYHFPSLWTNACCSHPRPGETIRIAARRRLWEELGIRTNLTPLFTFLYSARDPESGLVEREFDHVLAGRIRVESNPNPEEVSAVDLLHFDQLERRCAERPGDYTPWFRLALRELRERGFVREWAAPLRA